VFVATGPLWLPEKEAEGKYMMKYPLIGHPPALVSVPTHFYKVILVEPKDIDGNATDQTVLQPNCAVAVFVMPNKPISADYPLTRFVVPISDLETATGLKFFPKYLNESKRKELDKSAQIWRSIGKALHKGKGNRPLLETLDSTDSDKAVRVPDQNARNQLTITSQIIKLFRV